MTKNSRDATGCNVGLDIDGVRESIYRSEVQGPPKMQERLADLQKGLIHTIFVSITIDILPEGWDTPGG